MKISRTKVYRRKPIARPHKKYFQGWAIDTLMLNMKYFINSLQLVELALIVNKLKC